MKKALATVLLLACAACGSTTTSSDDAPTEDALASPEADQPDGKPLFATLITLDAPVKAKQCYGSAGCNVTFTIRPTLAAREDGLDGTYDVTYRVTGSSDGPVINTFRMYADGQYEIPDDTTVSTSTGKAQIKAVVTSVEKVD